MRTIGVIGGSGLYELEGLEDVESKKVETPWGDPSDKLMTGRLGDTKMIFLPRHGRGHRILPSEINYRANIYALKQLGVSYIISVSAVGSMREEIAPGHIVIPMQYFDHTKNRISTFFGDGIVAHVSMADPVCPILSEALYEASINMGAEVHKGGVYICIEGPQFSSRAESHIYRKWGVDVIGMTNMPEAKLAREAEICYATLALCSDYDCWHDHHEAVSVEDIIQTLEKNLELAKKILKEVNNTLTEERNCNCTNALQDAIITSRDSINEEVKERLGPLIKGYIE
ncbi:S-methyl-5'-thioadenosine phosphorylase [Desulfobacterota bacterium AH_259_B03_O07]|nr:S-methyl-5'-thioadenosine phosphorylase [Desulfobacterota bacterium AH_259_B03_O07]